MIRAGRAKRALTDAKAAAAKDLADAKADAKEATQFAKMQVALEKKGLALAPQIVFGLPIAVDSLNTKAASTTR